MDHITDHITDRAREQTMAHDNGTNCSHIQGVDLRMFILDVLRYDIEPLESILKLLNNDSCVGWRQFWPRDFTGAEIVPALKELIEKGYVDVYEMSADERELVPTDMARLSLEDSAGNYWYLLTDLGRRVWNEWQPPIDDVVKR